MKLDVIYNKSCQQMTELPDESIDMVMTSPPYWGLRDYGEDVKEIWGGNPDCEHQWDFEQVIHDNLRFRGKNSDVRNEQKVGIHSGSITKSGFCVKCNAWYGQLGLEPTFQLYLDHMMIVCAEIKRVLKKTGSSWLNMGDTYGGSCGGHGDTGLFTNSKRRKTAECMYNTLKPQRHTMAKCLLGIPSRLRNRLVDEQGWTCRNAIIWHKPNAMPSSVKDRCSNSYEHLFHLVKAKKYYYDLDAIREPYTEPLNRWGGPKTKITDKSKGNEFAVQERAGRERRPHGAGKNPGDCWRIPTQPRPEAHFATFPDKLCIKPILASCPAEICKKCGKARVRITKSKFTAHTGITQSEYQKGMSANRLALLRQAAREAGGEYVNERETIGWTDCGCNADWDSGVLLDPFAGRGTALIMAKKLGRHYVGYELKKEYWEMAERELEKIDPLFRKSKRDQAKKVH